MARELGCDRRWLLAFRHRLQEYARRFLDRNPLGDAVVESDEMYQNQRPAKELKLRQFSIPLLQLGQE